jgi:hypothetical protein
VAQRVDYETFKNMARCASKLACVFALAGAHGFAAAQVSVAHLRPLQAPNTRGDGACCASARLRKHESTLRLAQHH